MDANQKEKMELAEAKQQAKEEDERLRTEEEDQIRQEANGAITLVVLSDRVLPIQVSLGSVLMKTSYPLNIWVIGDDVAGLEDTLKRTLPLKSEQHVRVMTGHVGLHRVEDIHTDLGQIIQDRRYSPSV